MLLSTPSFVLFLLAAAALHRLLPPKFRRGFLLLASAVYYCSFHPAYLLLLAALVLLCHRLGIAMERAENDKKRSSLCTAGVAAILLLLALSKFSHLWANALLQLVGGGADLAVLFVPTGISYYSFSLIGYLVDVKKGKIAAEHDLAALSLFAGFFPQLLAGPIAHTDLLAQWQQPKTPTYTDFVLGAQRFFKGAVYKVILADGIAVLVNGHYAAPASCDGLLAWFVFLAYPLQLYFDFAGYSDMAIGAARMLGYTLQENFKAPYLAASFGEFWGRWHIGLSSWLRDYLYFPLGGSRKGEARTLLNLMAVFLFSGIWHGTTVGYAVWGALMGLARILERCAEKKHGKREKQGLRLHAARCGVYLWWAVTLLFFRSSSFGGVLAVLRAMFSLPAPTTALLQLLSLAQNGVAEGIPYYLFFFGSLLLALLTALRFDRAVYSGCMNPLSRCSERQRMALYMVFGVLIMLFYFLTTSGSSDVSFIYQGY